jgi:hypothetical protein
MGAPRSRLVGQPLQAIGHEPSTPLAHRAPRNPQFLSDVSVRGALRTRQHNSRPQSQCVCGLAPTRPTLQHLTFGVGQHHGQRLRTRHLHTLNCPRTYNSRHYHECHSRHTYVTHSCQLQTVRNHLFGGTPSDFWWRRNTARRDDIHSARRVQSRTGTAGRSASSRIHRPGSEFHRGGNSGGRHGIVVYLLRRPICSK